MHYLIWSTDPILVSFGPFHIYWYGLLFAMAILVGLEFMKRVYKIESKDEKSLDSLFLYIVVGIVVGARLGHCIFYDPDYYLANPMKIFAVWEGGLASHGGGLGALIALYFGCKKNRVKFIWFIDRVVIPTALFGFFVRIGNFMNSEILGKPTDVPWAIVFSRVDNLARHPAQLYEAFSYLIIFFILTYVYLKYRKNLKDGFLFGLFLVLVFSVRFIVEFFKVRQADYSLGIGLTTGQLLSIPFLILGILFIVWSRKK